MILVLNRKGKYSMYNFDELTSISLLISLYIAVAFYIYFQQKREWKNIVEHIRDSMPVSDNSIVCDSVDFTNSNDGFSYQEVFVKNKTVK